MEERSFYQKPALNLTQQIQLLQNKGFYISNTKEAVKRLSSVSYHRLSEYCHASQKIKTLNLYGSALTLDDPWTIYMFDRELRLLISDAIERIEVAFKTAMSNEMGILYGPHWYLNSQLFHPTKNHQKFIEQVQEICERPKEQSIQAYKCKYHTPIYPPCWVMLEALTFGSCSLLYSNIKAEKDRKLISHVLGQPPRVLASWMRALSYLRNLCAHHSRVWNRWFVDLMQHLEDHPEVLQTAENERLIYRHLAIIIILLAKISPGLLWKDCLYNLLEDYDNLPIHWMGFQEKWREDTFWELAT